MIVKSLKKEKKKKNISWTTLYRILNDLNFSTERQKRQVILLKRKGIILCHRNYQRKINDYKKDNKTIYYIDETWINEGHFFSLISKDTTEASFRTLIVDLAEPKGKKRRFKITHIGSEANFIPDAVDIFISNKGGDYQEKTHGNLYENPCFQS